ncbi:hypothetical protein N7488_003146 [Penicillium malachiteum]|nr:hypothetical protein N7488_003146 [Penicillium malachiteum]
MLYLLIHLVAVWAILYPIIRIRRQMAAIEAAVIEAAGSNDLEVDFEVLKEYYFGSNDPVGNPPSKDPCRVIKLLTFAKAAADYSHARQEVDPVGLREGYYGLGKMMRMHAEGGSLVILMTCEMHPPWTSSDRPYLYFSLLFFQRDAI